jgi:hypothetical protein
LIAVMFFTTGAPQLLLIAGLALPRLFLGASIYFCGSLIGRS